MEESTSLDFCIFAADSVSLVRYLARRCGAARISEILQDGDCHVAIADAVSEQLTSSLSEFPSIDFDATEAFATLPYSSDNSIEVGLSHAILVGVHATSQRFYGSWSSSLAKLIFIGHQLDHSYMLSLGGFIGWLGTLEKQDYQSVHYSLAKSMYCLMIGSRIGRDTSALLDQMLAESSETDFYDLCDGADADVSGWLSVMEQAVGAKSVIDILRAKIK